MVVKNTKNNLLGKDKVFAKRDTSYSSFWLYNKELDVSSQHFKDSFVNFYDDKKLLSEFNVNVAKNIISFWSEPEDLVLDPFSGRVRSLVSYAMNRKYIGYDVSKDVIQYMKQKLSELLTTDIQDKVELVNDDCINVLQKVERQSVDLVFTCPPYWDLEKYESREGQLSDYVDYDVFLVELIKRLVIAIETLKKDKYFCIIVGDFRRKGQYVTFHSDLLQCLGTISNIKLHDVVVIQNIPFNTAAFYFGGKKHLKYTAKAHEYLLVFKKL
jgi:DNA modification methylase